MAFSRLANEEITRKPYARPILVKRDKLALVSGEDSPAISLIIKPA